MLSASSFTVSHVKFTRELPNNPLKYYLGIASAGYIIAFFATIIGFYIAFVNHSIILDNVFSIALAIHFTALTAMRWPKLKHVVATLLGFVFIPLFTALTSLNTSFIITPIVIGILMISIPSKNKG